MTNIVELAREQRQLQFHGTKRDRKGKLTRKTDRSRTIDEYSSELNFYEIARKTKEKDWSILGLKKLIRKKIERKGYCVWVDLGCGNTVALRQGKMYLESVGIDPSKLRTYGIDVLPIDNDALEWHMKMFPKEYSAFLRDELYRPKFKTDDIETAKFTESADIVTGIEVLFWMQDPLKAVLNAYNQMNVNGILGFNRTSRIFYNDDGNTIVYRCNLFDCRSPLYQEIKKHCAIVDNSYNYTLFVQKKDEIKLETNIRLVNRSEGSAQGFSHMYTDAPL